MDKTSANRRLAAAVCAGLILLAAAVYWPVVGYGFVGYDDPAMVQENPLVANGLSPDMVLASFTGFNAGFWLPLTLVSLALDVDLYGMNPGGFHLTNLVLFAANAVLFFLALYFLTGSLWASAAAAALFALHPLRVESVAWITERKDVLSGLFWFAALAVYARYARTRSAAAYAGVTVLFALSFTAKPVAVTLPLVLLVLDYWPLGRFGAHADPAAREPFRKLVWEKTPLLALSAAGALATLWAQASCGALTSLGVLTPAERAANAVYAYGASLARFVWPVDLAVVYPHPQYGLTAWPVLASGALLIAATAAFVLLRNRAPFLLAGWLIYLGTLFPMTGVVQSGAQAYADRFTYLPHTGIVLMLAWGGVWLMREKALSRSLTMGGAALVLAAFFTLSSVQVRYWKDSATLFSHALSATKDNWMAHHLLGAALATELDRPAEGILHLKRALELNPSFADAWINLGNAHARAGQYQEAAYAFERALALEPDSTEGHAGLGGALAALGDPEAALAQYKEALQIDPVFAPARNNLGALYMDMGRVDEAVRQYELALSANPFLASAHVNLAMALKTRGRHEEAAGHFQQALAIDPDCARAENGLGILLVEMGSVEDALGHLKRAVEIDPDYKDARFNLGVVLLGAGKPQEALPHLEAAAALCPDDPGAWAAWADALMQAGRPQEAKARVQRALELSPGHPWAAGLARRLKES
ncbi:MAG: tetratricopeptide repeat protein [Deltaproteobacteria bacterium]|nr:tetratricopeptide repeat protein [Deltaproteobacteria bacterium]